MVKGFLNPVRALSGGIRPCFKKIPVLLADGGDPEFMDLLTSKFSNRKDLCINIVKAVGIHTKIKYQLDICQGCKRGFHRDGDYILVHHEGLPWDG